MRPEPKTQPRSASEASDARESFAEAYAGHFDRVYRTAVASCGDPEVALEATQDAFALALARWPRLRSQPWMPAWIVVTATNRCRRLLRPETLRSRLLKRQVPTATVDPYRDERSAVRSALAQLPNRQRQIILLHYFGGYSIAEISEATGLSNGTVKTHLHRGRVRLRPLLREHEPDPSPEGTSR